MICLHQHLSNVQTGHDRMNQKTQLVLLIISLLIAAIPFRVDGHPTRSDLMPLNCTAPYQGPDYFVSADGGDDSHNGSHDCPFQTLQKAADTVAPNAQNRILVHAGLYPETLRLQTEGVDFLAYAGETPIISGSQPISRWEQPPGATYHIAQVSDDGSGTPIRVQIVIANDVLFDPVESAADLVTNTFYQDGYNLYAQFETGLDPNSADIGIIKWIEDYNETDIVHITDTNDILFSGFKIRYAAGDGIVVGSASGITIADCDIRYSNLRGIIVSQSTNVTVINNDVSYNTLSNYPRLVGRLPSWGQGISFYSGSDVKVINNRVAKNNGEGIGGWGGWDHAGPIGMLIEGNTVFDNWGVNIYLDGASQVTVRKNLVYASGDYPKVDPDHEDTGNKSVPIGIELAKELGRPTSGGDPSFPGDLTHITLTNNLIINCLAGFAFWHDDEASGLKYVNVVNNTIVNTNTDLDAVWTGISINHSDHHIDSSFVNNLVYHNNGGLVSYREPMDEILFAHNGWYHAYGDWPVFRKRDDPQANYTFSEWCAFPNRGEGSLFADPMMLVGTGFSPNSYALTLNSPMRDQGASTLLTSEDFLGIPRPQGTGFDIGAFEWLAPSFFLPWVAGAANQP